MSADASNGGPAAGGTPAGTVEPTPEELVARVQELSARLEEVRDPIARESAEELVAAVLELYGVGLERIFAALDEAGDAGDALRERLTADGVVASLMLIHGLYPVGLDQRVIEALDSVRPYMESHGGDVELLGIEEGVARIRLEGSCEGCPASASTLELAIKSALEEAAPDLDGLVVEGAVGAPSAAVPGGLELPVIQATPVAAGGPPSWFDLAGAAGIGEGDVRGLEVTGTRLAVARVEGSLLAFLDRCPACGSAISAGVLADGVLSCPGCDRGYFLPRAGRSIDDERLLLEPVPLLDGAGGARVALAAR
jgi:Fe-S cluster biogenesis protein NfuA/nitrite reductase/ring-hydroxylating ferredoxin subunit